MTPEEQLEDLQRRFQLLEGERKATYETAKLTIQQNKEIIRQMKDEGKLLQQQIVMIRTEKPPSTQKQVEDKMAEVQILQRKVDTTKSETERKRQQLEELESKLNELVMESKVPATEASPQLRQIRVLENRLDKATMKFNEAQSIRKTYEAIVKRLSEERIGFDKQLAEIEQTVKAKERDHEELLLLSSDASHAKEMAQAELHQFEQSVLEQRAQRGREVQDKKALVQQRVEMNQRLEQRERMLKRQDQDRVERHLKELSATSDLTTGITSNLEQEERKKLINYEEAFNRIKDATGVPGAEEVIRKFMTQEDTFKSLSELTAENQAKMDLLMEEKRNQLSLIEELKFSGGGNLGRRQVIDDFEAHLSEATEKFERKRGKFERSAKILISMKAGVTHLAEKLSCIKLDGDVQRTDDFVQNLEHCELKLTKLMALTQHLDDPDLRKQSLKFDDEQYEEKLLSRSQSDVRIKLQEPELHAQDEDDDFEEEMDEDVCSRKHVKYNSERILEKQHKHNRKKGKHKKMWEL